MQRYRSSLHQMITGRSSGKLGSVTWEVSRGSGIHIHWQFLPIPADLIHGGLVEAAFKVEAENLSYPRFASTSASADGSNEPGDFFRVWIWSSAEGNEKAEAEKTLMLELTPDFRFDLQFGRRVMAKLLELDKRMNWKDATQAVEEEQGDAEAFKEAFKKYDFSLE
jgi:hypothetical protein